MANCFVEHIILVTYYLGKRQSSVCGLANFAAEENRNVRIMRTKNLARHPRAAAAGVLAAVLLSLPAGAQTGSAALSPAVENALRLAVSSPVSTHQAPGVMLLVAQDGRVVFADAAGMAGPPPAKALRTDTIFWAASMSKPVTAAAILMLADEGRLHLDDPVARYIPALHALRVRSGGSSVPASRDITLRDLLTHTAGMPSSMGAPPPGAMPPGAEPPPAGGIVAPPVSERQTLADWVGTLGATGLEHQPGAAWAYSPGAGYDVLGRVVEVVSGQDLRAFVSARILAPLGMRDTTYGIPASAGDRLMPLPPRFAGDPRVIGTRYVSGSAGMFTTMADYARFGTMLAEGGVAPGGQRLLSAKAVADLSTNQVGTLFSGVLGRRHRPGEGFGYGVAIILDPKSSGVAVPAGSYGWDGAGGSRFWVSPQQRRVLVEFAPPKVQAALEQAVTEALPDPAAAGCDRACLGAVLDRFLAGLYRHDPAAAGLAPGFRGTENAQAAAPGSGLWRTALGAGAVQRRYLDTESGQAALFGTLREADPAKGPQDDIVSLRIKVADGLVAEAEWTIARPGPGMFSVQGLLDAPPPDALLPPARRTDRARMVAAADAYFQALQAHDGSHLAHVPGCDRVENGVRVTNRSGPPPGVSLPPGMPGAGPTGVPGAAAEMKSGDCVAGFDRFAHTIASTDFRRYPVVDVAQGVVLGETLFHRPPGSPMKRNLLNEYFWIDSGRIAGMYATMHYMPAEAPDTTGWK